MEGVAIPTVSFKEDQDRNNIIKTTSMATESVLTLSGSPQYQEQRGTGVYTLVSVNDMSKNHITLDDIETSM